MPFKTIDTMTLEEQFDLLNKFDALPSKVKMFIWEESKDLFDAYLEYGVFRFSLAVASEVTLIEKCESPIEQLMILAIDRHFLRNIHFINWQSQAQINANGKEYRVDILLTYTLDRIEEHHSCKYLVVECDGHNFHEKTKQQAQKDKERDRNLQIAGYPVLRFTGSEIWKNPMKCAEEIETFIDSSLISRG